MSRKGKEGDSFEKSLERLEGIVEEMEEGRLGLEEMVARFEEGQKLIASCTKKLTEVERRIEKLVQRGDQAVCVPLEEEAEANSSANAADEPQSEDDAPF